MGWAQGRPVSNNPAGSRESAACCARVLRPVGNKLSFKSDNSVVRRNPRTCDFTWSNPTIDANKSSTRSRGPLPRNVVVVVFITAPRESLNTDADRFFTASINTASLVVSRSLNNNSNSFGSNPAAYSACGNRSANRRTHKSASCKSLPCRPPLWFNPASLRSNALARSSYLSAFWRRVNSGGGGRPSNMAMTASLEESPSAKAKSKGVMPSSFCK
mmetsp:Transcript_13332/g.20305  ORF Transcript_13332/g.20305 Transcript_13332/m.20305 type:complete len:216 (-) Transcript_13332:577-1224(-)